MEQVKQAESLLNFYMGLTGRQRQVLELTSFGLSNQEIAAQLCIEPSVVAGHLTNIYDLLANDEAYTRQCRPNRYILIRCFTLFFVRYPEFQRFADASWLP